MKIVSIFDGKLFAFLYQGENMNELKRLLDLWNDNEHLFSFTKQHQKDLPKNIEIEDLIELLIDDANIIDEFLIEIGTNKNRTFDEFFKQLDNQEYQLKVLSRQKGRKNYLRLYALKIDSNCFVITGGAIKFTHLMQERSHTNAELSKLNKCKEFLRNNNVFDRDSFYEYLKEEDL